VNQIAILLTIWKLGKVSLGELRYALGKRGQRAAYSWVLSLMQELAEIGLVREEVYGGVLTKRRVRVYSLTPLGERVAAMLEEATRPEWAGGRG